MERMFPKQSAELRTFMSELFVPEIQRTKKPFAFSKGKQEVVHKGPNKLTHSVAWVRRWKLMVSKRKPREPENKTKQNKTQNKKIVEK
jgi:hypothetical protein